MSKKVLFAVVLGILLGSVGLVIHQQHVQAAGAGCNGTDPQFNLPYCKGYFTGRTAPNFNSATLVLPSGLFAANSTDLITYITDYLSGNDPFGKGRCKGVAATQCEAGAAFIIDTMLNQPASNAGTAAGIGFARNPINFNRWVALVNFYAVNPPAGFGVQFNYPSGPIVCNGGTLNSGWFTSLADDAFHGSDCTGPNTGLDATQELIFFGPWGSFKIGQTCGNIESSDKAPPPQQQTFSCAGATISPTNFDPTTPFTVSATVTSSNGQAPPPGTSMWISIVPTLPAKFSYPQTTQVTYPTISIRAGPTNETGQYTIYWNLNGSSAINPNCSSNFSVADSPYLKVYGGDVSVTGSPQADYGNSFSNTPSVGCETKQTQGGIFSWNNDINGSPAYSGAGTQYAVYALGSIEGFASAQESSSSPSPPSGLAFAYPGSSGAGLYGGSFGAKSVVNCNFTYDCIFQNGVVFITGGQSSCPSNQPVCPNGGTPSNKLICPEASIPSLINLGQSKTIFTFGNVYLDHDVIYQKNTNSGGQVIGWTSPSQIPYFRIVIIGGNLYLGPSVHELDGVYVAEPSIENGNKVGGTIYTCSSGALTQRQVPVVLPSSIPNYYNACGAQLQIYGSFVAEQVEFLRTSGSVTKAPSDALNNTSTPLSSTNGAEVFEYTPEVWLPRSTKNPSDNYTAISGLPPVL